jgi:hypothetical protein
MTNGKQKVEKIADGEVVEHLPMTAGMLATITKAELDTAISTARAYPRNLHQAIDNIKSLVCYDEQSALEAVYALPRGGKPIKGPSVRLAEIVAQCWGNCRVEARVLEIDRGNKVIVSEGTFHDLQTNAATRATVNRRISDKAGRLFSDDMIVTTGNAACSIARRNAILAGVPRMAWRQAYEAAEHTIAGDIKTLAERREKAIKAFAAFGVKPEQILGLLDVKSIEEIGLEDIGSLLGAYNALKDGSETVESLFDPRRTAGSFEGVSNPLKDEPESKQTDTPTNESESGTKNESAQATPEQKNDRTASAHEATHEATHGLMSEANAFARGKADRAKGMQRKAVPIEFRVPDRSAEAKAWWDGWDAGESPKQQ